MTKETKLPLMASGKTVRIVKATDWLLRRNR